MYDDRKTVDKMDLEAPEKFEVTLTMIGNFTKHSGDKFDLKLSAIENMLATYALV